MYLQILFSEEKKDFSLGEEEERSFLKGPQFAAEPQQEGASVEVRQELIDMFVCLF